MALLCWLTVVGFHASPACAANDGRERSRAVARVPPSLPIPMATATPDAGRQGSNLHDLRDTDMRVVRHLADATQRCRPTAMPPDRELRAWRRLGISLLSITACYWIWEQSTRARQRSIDFPYMGVKMVWRTPRRQGLEKRD